MRYIAIPGQIVHSENPKRYPFTPLLFWKQYLIQLHIPVRKKSNKKPMLSSNAIPCKKAYYPGGHQLATSSLVVF